MIYTNGHDIQDVDHLLIFDHTTPIAVLKLPFKVKNCLYMEEWNNMARECLQNWAIQNKYNFKDLNAKVIKVYHDVN